MQFFEHQDQARGRTSLLVGLFIFAVAALVSVVCVVVHYVLVFQRPADEPLSADHWQLVGIAGAATFGIIVAGALYRLAQLSSGGVKVAETLGGTLVAPTTTDPLERRAINVVEEMAIAAGLPVPPVYLLRQEMGINAFAAGWSPDDAVIGITQGALEGLKREQLQGVIAHEFSHVLNRDCALNMKLMGVLHGILLISIIGQILMRSGGRSRSSSRSDGRLILVGVAVWALGSLGVLVARIIQAAVSRQREFLADASAVQFTRNPIGIGGALATIGARGSALESARGGEASHMLIGEPTASLLGALASHPPLPERIQRILPRWDGNLAALATPPGSVQRSLETGTEEMDERDDRVAQELLLGDVGPQILDGSVAGFAGAAPAAAPSTRLSAAQASPETAVSRAARLLAQIPAPLRHAAKEPFSARALIMAWLLDEREQPRTTQLAILRNDAPLAEETRRLYQQLPSLDPVALLPLFDVAVGTLGTLSERQRGDFQVLLEAVTAHLSPTAYRSYCLASLALRRLNPRRQKRQPGRLLVKDAVEAVLGVLAVQGHDTEQDAQNAFSGGAASLGRRGKSLRLPSPATLTVETLDSAFGTLLTLPTTTRAELLNAAERVAAHDGVMRPREAELLRAMATSLGVAAEPAFATANR